MTVAQARAHLAEGQFPPGSMGPKIEAAAQFVQETGGTATVTSLDRVVDALAGASGHPHHPVSTRRSVLTWRPPAPAAVPGGLGPGARAARGPPGLRQLHDLPRRLPHPRVGSGRRLPRRRDRPRPRRLGRPRMDGQPHRAVARRAGRDAGGRRRGARRPLLAGPRRGPARPDGHRPAGPRARRGLRRDRHRGRAGRGRLRRAHLPGPRRRGDRHRPGLLPLRPRPAPRRRGAGVGAPGRPATAGAWTRTRSRRPSRRARR